MRSDPSSVARMRGSLEKPSRTTARIRIPSMGRCVTGAQRSNPSGSLGRHLLERWDFHGAELDEMLEKIVSKPKAWLELMMAHELYLAPVDPTQARRSAVLVGIAAILGSLIPLIPFIVIGRDILLGTAVSLVVSTLALFAIGWWKARTP